MNKFAELLLNKAALQLRPSVGWCCSFTSRASSVACSLEPSPIFNSADDPVRQAAGVNCQGKGTDAVLCSRASPGLSRTATAWQSPVPQPSGHNQQFLRCLASKPALSTAEETLDDRAVGSYTPVTKQLWSERSKLSSSDFKNGKLATSTAPKSPKKTVVQYPFSTSRVLHVSNDDWYCTCCRFDAEQWNLASCKFTGSVSHVSSFHVKLLTHAHHFHAQVPTRTCSRWFALQKLELTSATGITA